MKKLKWYGVLFAFLILFLYIMGTYDLFMMLTQNAEYYAGKGYGEAVFNYFTDYPFYLLVFWVANLLCGLLSPLLYFTRNVHAYKVTFVSAAADFILIVLGVLFRDRFNVLGAEIFCFDVFILVITFLFGLYLFVEQRNAVYRSHE